MIIAFVVLFVIVSAYAVVVTIVARRYAKHLFRIEDDVPKINATFDECLAKMKTVLSRPLFYDSPEIRMVIEQIRRCYDAIASLTIVTSAPDDE